MKNLKELLYAADKNLDEAKKLAKQEERRTGGDSAVSEIIEVGSAVMDLIQLELEAMEEPEAMNTASENLRHRSLAVLREWLECQ